MWRPRPRIVRRSKVAANLAVPGQLDSIQASSLLRRSDGHLDGLARRFRRWRVYARYAVHAMARSMKVDGSGTRSMAGVPISSRLSRKSVGSSEALNTKRKSCCDQGEKPMSNRSKYSRYVANCPEHGEPGPIVGPPSAYNSVRKRRSVRFRAGDRLSRAAAPMIVAPPGEHFAIPCAVVAAIGSVGVPGMRPHPTAPSRAGLFSKSATLFLDNSQARRQTA